MSSSNEHSACGLPKTQKKKYYLVSRWRKDLGNRKTKLVCGEKSVVLLPPSQKTFQLQTFSVYQLCKSTDNLCVHFVCNVASRTENAHAEILLRF